MQLQWHELLMLVPGFAVHAGVCNVSPRYAVNVLLGRIKG